MKPFALRLSDKTYEEIRERAHNAHISMNQLIEILLTLQLEQTEPVIKK